jgi:hypothetical protein
MVKRFYLFLNKYDMIQCLYLYGMYSLCKHLNIERGVNIIVFQYFGLKIIWQSINYTIYHYHLISNENLIESLNVGYVTIRMYNYLGCILLPWFIYGDYKSLENKSLGL